jgi:hypothetical protein
VVIVCGPFNLCSRAADQFWNNSRTASGFLEKLTVRELLIGFTVPFLPNKYGRGRRGRFNYRLGRRAAFISCVLPRPHARARGALSPSPYHSDRSLRSANLFTLYSRTLAVLAVPPSLVDGVHVASILRGELKLRLYHIIVSPFFPRVPIRLTRRGRIWGSCIVLSERSASQVCDAMTERGMRTV